MVLEGVGKSFKWGSYNDFGRVAALSGVPSTLGWTQHVIGWNKGFHRCPPTDVGMYGEQVTRQLRAYCASTVAVRQNTPF